MNVGDLVQVECVADNWDLIVGSGTIVSISDSNIGFYNVLFQGEVRIFHSDYLEVIDESR